MLDRLFSFITDFWEDLLPFQVINHFERAVVLRLGKFNRTLGPGFHLKIPFAEEVWSDRVTARTINLSPQTLTTADGKTVVVSTVVSTTISDIKTALLEVEGVDDAMEDVCYGVIGHIVLTHKWDELQDIDLEEEAMTQMNEAAKRYGVNIANVQFSDLAYIRTYRIMR